MRPGHVMLALLILVGGYAASHAEPEAPTALEPLQRTEIGREPLWPLVLKSSPPSVGSTILGALTRNLSWVPGVLLFLAALLKRDRGAWWFAFLAGVATFVIFGSSAFITHFGLWLKEPIGMLVGTSVVLLMTFGMFVLHQKRLDIFARTEIALTFDAVRIALAGVPREGGGDQDLHNPEDGGGRSTTGNSASGMLLLGALALLARRRTPLRARVRDAKAAALRVAL